MNIIEKIDGYLNEATNQMVVLTDDDFDNLDPKAKRMWKGYGFTMTYETRDEESIEAGDTDNKGWEYKKSPHKYDSLEDLLSDGPIANKSWLEWSSSHPGPGDWIISQDDENYSTGEKTQYHLFIKRNDNKKLTKEEIKYIHRELGLYGRV